MWKFANPGTALNTQAAEIIDDWPCSFRSGLAYNEANNQVYWTQNGESSCVWCATLAHGTPRSFVQSSWALVKASICRRSWFGAQLRRDYLLMRMNAWLMARRSVCSRPGKYYALNRALYGLRYLDNAGNGVANSHSVLGRVCVLLVPDSVHLGCVSFAACVDDGAAKAV